MVALYFEAWGKYRVEHDLNVRGRDSLLPILKALGGTSALRLDGATAPGGDGVTDDVLGYYAALVRTRPVSAVAVARILTDYFGVAVALEEFAGGWDPLPERQRSILGTATPRLGYGFTLGTRLWRNDLRVTVGIGPLDTAGFERFLPHGQAARALEKLLAILAIPNLRFEARILLNIASVETLTLSTRNPGHAQRLGWSTFVATRPADMQQAEAKFRLAPAIR